MNKKGYVAGIGAANIDIYGRSDVPIRQGMDHPAEIFTGAGGVTRNIMDNLARLDIPVRFMTVFGDDIYGEMLRKSCIERKIDISAAKTVLGAATGIFMQVQNENNDMYIALCDMRIMEHINTDYLKERKDLLEGAKAIVVDPSLTEECLGYLVEQYGQKIFVDPVSDIYAGKIRPYAGRICALKPNRTELSVLSGIEVNDEESMVEAGRRLLDAGLQQLYVSLGADGCFYMDRERILKRSLPAEAEMVNASGAGDSFFAGMICGYVNGFPLEKTLDLALAAGLLAVRSPSAISDEMSLESLEKLIEEVRHEH